MTIEKLFSREIHLKHRPAGMPTENDFQLVRLEVPDLRGWRILGAQLMDVSRSIYAWTYERN